MCRRPGMDLQEQEQAFFEWLKQEKLVTHARHDITRAISEKVEEFRAALGIVPVDGQ